MTDSTEDGIITQALLDDYSLIKFDPHPALTDEANEETAWQVTRTKPPFTGADRLRQWYGSTPQEAIAKARAAIGGRKE